MEIIQGFDLSGFDMIKSNQESLVRKALLRGLITRAGAEDLIKEIWNDR